MKYFRIKHTINSTIIGREYPQVEKVLIPTTWFDPKFIQSFVDRKATSDVLLPTPILYKSAKLTDLVSGSAVGLSLNLIISENLFNLIQDFNKSGIQFFKIKVIRKNVEYLYILAHSFASAFMTLNFTQSEIGFTKELGSANLIEPLYINNETEFKKYAEDYENYLNFSATINKFLLIKTIIICERTDIDFFSLKYVYGGTGYFVSERLKNRIEAAGCTGMIFTEPNERYP